MLSLSKHRPFLLADARNPPKKEQSFDKLRTDGFGAAAVGRALFPALLLAACSGGDKAQAVASGAAEEPVAVEEPEDNLVACALGGAKSFGRTCTREIAQEDLGEVWIVRHPDGGFRRFVLIDGGTRIATADGDKEVTTSRVGSELEVRVEGDAYRFPAAPEPQASGS